MAGERQKLQLEFRAGAILVVHRLPPVPLDRTGLLLPQRTACRVHVQRAAVRLRSTGGRHLRCTSDLPLPPPTPRLHPRTDRARPRHIPSRRSLNIPRMNAVDVYDFTYD